VIIQKEVGLQLWEYVDAAMVAKCSTPVPQESGKICGLVAEIRKKAVAPWKIRPQGYLLLPFH
jgi:hypothetical protein